MRSVIGASAMASEPTNISPSPQPMARGEPLRAAIIRSSCAVEQEAERKGAVQAFQGVAGGLDRGRAPVHRAPGQKDDGFGVGLGFLGIAIGGQFGAQVAEVLDDAVVDDGDRRLRGAGGRW